MSKKLRILQINKYFFPVIGGIETHVFDIVNNLDDEIDFKVLVCNTKNETEILKEKKHEIIKVGSIGKFFSMPLSFGYFKQFRELSRGADIIHFHHPFPLGELACLMYNPKAKIIITWHSDILKQKFFMYFYKPFLMKFLARADKIIVTSPNMAKFSPYLKDFQNKIVIIPLGINIKTLKHENIKTIKPIRNKFAKNKNLILSVGRLSYYKGFEYLIEAMRNVDANLVIIGSGPLKNKLLLQATTYKLQAKVFILDHVSDIDLKNFYNACDIFVLPSVAKTEAFGIVQLEAMSAGKPVINTNLPTGVPWVSINGETGLTVPPKDSRSLSKAINKLINNPDLISKYGKNAKDRVKKYFAKDKMIKSIKCIYNKI